MDLLVGMWAEKNVPKMDAAQLKAMEEVLDQENPDLFKWLTGQESASEGHDGQPCLQGMASCTYLCIHRLMPAQLPSCLLKSLSGSISRRLMLLSKAVMSKGRAAACSPGIQQVAVF